MKIIIMSDRLIVSNLYRIPPDHGPLHGIEVIIYREHDSNKDCINEAEMVAVIDAIHMMKK